MRWFRREKSEEKAVKRHLAKKRLELCRFATPQIFPVSGREFGRTFFDCECGFTVEEEMYTMGTKMKCGRCAREYMVAIAFIAEPFIDRSKNES